MKAKGENVKNGQFMIIVGLLIMNMAAHESGEGVQIILASICVANGLAIMFKNYLEGKYESSCVPALCRKETG